MRGQGSLHGSASRTFRQARQFASSSSRLVKEGAGWIWARGADAVAALVVQVGRAMDGVEEYYLLLTPRCTRVRS